MTGPTPSPTTNPIYMRLRKAADLVGISRATLYRWAAAGKITLTKHDHMTFISLPELHAVIAGTTKTGR